MNKEIFFYEFTQLSDEQQYDLLFREGELLDSSTRNEVKFVLYKLYSFFVEVVYVAGDNKIVTLSSFTNARN